MNSILAIYTILLLVTISLLLCVNQRCHRLECGIPLTEVIETYGAPLVFSLMLLTLTLLLPITLLQNLHAIFLDDERFTAMANRCAITF